MSKRHVFADEVGALLSEIAGRGLRREEVGNIVQQALVETGAANFSTANFAALDHGFRSFVHPAFMPAWDQVGYRDWR